MTLPGDLPDPSDLPEGGSTSGRSPEPSGPTDDGTAGNGAAGEDEVGKGEVDDVDARFAELVARFDAEEVTGGGRPGATSATAPATDGTPETGHDPRYVSGYVDPLAEEPFSPPDPPPLPRGTPRTRWAWAAAVGCPAIYVLLGVVGRTADNLTSLVLAAGFIAGVATLVAGMRTSRDDDDDGAVV
jgi:hypothetical protein